MHHIRIRKYPVIRQFSVAFLLSLIALSQILGLSLDLYEMWNLILKKFSEKCELIIVGLSIRCFLVHRRKKNGREKGYVKNGLKSKKN